MLTLDHCLNRLVPDDDLDCVWCTRSHAHPGNHRGVRFGLIIEWDLLGYEVGRSPAPEGLDA